MLGLGLFQDHEDWAFITFYNIGTLRYRQMIRSMLMYIVNSIAEFRMRQIQISVPLMAQVALKILG